MSGRRTQQYWEDIDRDFSRQDAGAPPRHGSGRGASAASSTGSAVEPVSGAQQRLAEVERELEELQKAEAAVLRAKKRRDQLREADKRREEALEHERAVERRSRAAEEVRGRSEGVRADFHKPHTKEAVGPSGRPISGHVDGNRAARERWGMSPIWGGGHTQYMERARRAREDAEDNAEVMRERQDLYTKDNVEVQQAKELYRRMVQQDSDIAARGSPRPPHR